MKIKPVWKDIADKREATVIKVLSAEDRTKRELDYKRSKRGRCTHPPEYIIKGDGRSVGQLKVCRLCGEIVNDPDLADLDKD
jgi:hypothetical protein